METAPNSLYATSRLVHFDEPLFEYLLVATPEKHIYQQVMVEKQLFADTYKEQIAIKTKPHITGSRFFAKEAMEATIIRWMGRAIGMQQKFIVALNNYSGFPPHSIYIRIQEHQPFKQLATALEPIDQYVRSNDCPPMRLIRHPHLTIARKLSTQVFEKAIRNYAEKTFEASFEVQELVLLRRKDQFDTCKQICSFHLNQA
ncbi:2'-5' RNA ligase family protein [Parasediminibacterium sp. JCM 36343]|uniref:2'-5' RNA ligase family protein n=1 Tax=Parasediminibacterium sp. JCM 36343 TaxID=3374279 RepID=UPI00397C9A67